METQDFKKLLCSVFFENKLDKYLTEKKLLQFELLYRHIIEENSQTNITAITDPTGVALKHFADCVIIANVIPLHAQLIDVGCGGGFPSLPLAISRPDLKITALDSTMKKISFVQNAARALKVENLSAVCARAEDYVREKRETYDVCVSRAVARMNILAELCLPYVKKKGIFVAMKSISAAEELEESKSAINKLGGNFRENFDFELNYLGEKAFRSVLIIEKSESTPKAYPRKFSQIKKSPL